MFQGEVWLAWFNSEATEYSVCLGRGCWGWLELVWGGGAGGQSDRCMAGPEGWERLHPKKKSLFPVHWLTIIMAIRAVAKNFFFFVCFLVNKINWNCWGQSDKCMAGLEVRGEEEM